jgi:hypothetical protein
MHWQMHPDGTNTGTMSGMEVAFAPQDTPDDVRQAAFFRRLAQPKHRVRPHLVF